MRPSGPAPSVASPGSSTGATDTEVSGAVVTMDAPHEEQKFTPSGFWWPHW
jgi:hypothetical protein